MADLRDAMKKAGVVSDKQVRQSRHEARVHRSEVGAEGVEAERMRRDEELRAETERRGAADAERDRARRAGAEAEARRVRLKALVRDHDLSVSDAGPRRFYFTVAGGEIAFVDVSDPLARRLAQGDAAIIDGRGFLERDFGIVSGKIAVECETIERSSILLWNAR
jgi:uncharacterized protein YaiL (DUF2058 family)